MTNAEKVYSIFLTALEQVDKARKDIAKNGFTYEVLSHVNKHMEVQLDGEPLPKSKEEFHKCFTADSLIRLYLWDVYLYLTPDFGSKLTGSGKNIGCFCLDEYINESDVDISDFDDVLKRVKEMYPTAEKFEQMCEWADTLDENSHCVLYVEYDPHNENVQAAGK